MGRSHARALRRKHVCAIRSMTDKRGLSGLQGRVINRWRRARVRLIG
ncbi:hypothetical protein PGR6_50070 [Pseudomonas sp. GR 6-02]|nr:hypothetical protein PGR6_50070 [Pseudomonas sp. GR 6-02]